MKSGNSCEMSVEDNGIGLSEEDAKRIFEPFVRLHDNDAYEGSGMGLATCQKIVKRHGGEIVARPRSGNGAVFIIRLPLRN
jgi:signal transduction histidine kinase